MLTAISSGVTRQDGNADGGVHQGDGLLRNARLPEPLVHRRGLRQEADDSHIGKGSRSTWSSTWKSRI